MLRFTIPLRCWKGRWNGSCLRTARFSKMPSDFGGQGMQTTYLQSVAVSCIIYLALCLLVMVFATVKASIGTLWKICVVRSCYPIAHSLVKDSASLPSSGSSLTAVALHCQFACSPSSSIFMECVTLQISMRIGCSLKKLEEALHGGVGAAKRQRSARRA